MADVNLRKDHVGGAAFILIGVLVLSMSDDLPFGTLASPGAGMIGALDPRHPAGTTARQ